MQETTIAAIATAPGAGGIAVVRLSGAESYPIAARVFRPANAAKKVEDAKGYTAMYGTFREGDEAFDEGVALFFRAPHSYTGEDVVELSCHGGSAVARRLVEACLAAGAQPAAPGEYTRRAFLNGKLSLTQAEAVMDIISADGRQGAALANASLNGALARKIAAQKDALTALQAHLAAWVDFPEEDVPELSQSHLCDALGGVEQELDALIQSYDAGAVLREGVDCAIVGKPNAGKSTLLKSLFGLVHIHSGKLLLKGEDITNLRADKLVSRGVGFVPQTENVFPSLTIAENLHMGAFQAPKLFNERFDYVCSIFPKLGQRKNQLAGQLSGGERQMVAMARALMMKPSVLLLDEPSAGLSPMLQDETFIRVRQVNKAGVSVVIVEQNARRCLQICDRGYVLDQGRNAYSGKGRDLMNDPKVVSLYLGNLEEEVQEEGR